MSGGMQGEPFSPNSESQPEAANAGSPTPSSAAPEPPSTEAADDNNTGAKPKVSMSGVPIMRMNTAAYMNQQGNYLRIS